MTERLRHLTLAPSGNNNTIRIRLPWLNNLSVLQALKFAPANAPDIALQAVAWPLGDNTTLELLASIPSCSELHVLCCSWPLEPAAARAAGRAMPVGCKVLYTDYVPLALSYVCEGINERFVGEDAGSHIVEFRVRDWMQGDRGFGAGVRVVRAK